MQRFKRILVMVDERHDGTGLLERAAALAKQNQACLTVVDIEPEPAWEDSTGSIPREHVMTLVDQLAMQRAASLEVMVAAIREQGVPVQIKLLQGRPFLAITQEVLRNGHDLLMLLTAVQTAKLFLLAHTSCEWISGKSGLIIRS